MKLLEMPTVLETQTQLGYAETAAFRLGQLFLVCTILYAVRAHPSSAQSWSRPISAATHVRVRSPLFTHVPFGVYLGLLVWGGLFLRDDRIRALVLRN